LYLTPLIEELDLHQRIIAAACLNSTNLTAIAGAEAVMASVYAFLRNLRVDIWEYRGSCTPEPGRRNPRSAIWYNQLQHIEGQLDLIDAALRDCTEKDVYAFEIIRAAASARE
jgi:hypothetical protein